MAAGPERPAPPAELAKGSQHAALARALEVAAGVGLQGRERDAQRIGHGGKQPGNGKARSIFMTRLWVDGCPELRARKGASHVFFRLRGDASAPAAAAIPALR
jgi:hypothetical protein